MKSIIQEATSIQKAIEKAWERAGKPEEFTIKILEAPEKNFFGFKTVKAAKVAFYFGEKGKTVQKGYIRPLNDSQPRQSTEKNTDARPSSRPQRPARPQRSDARPDRRDKKDTRPASSDQRGQRRTFDNASWTDEMMNTAKEWVVDAIKELGRGDIHITPHLSQNYYKLRLSGPVAEDANQSEMILKSWSNLSMDAVREKFKQRLGNLRVIVEVNQSHDRTPR